jgi:hypothetical protein
MATLIKGPRSGVGAGLELRPIEKSTLSIEEPKKTAETCYGCATPRPSDAKIAVSWQLIALSSAPHVVRHLTPRPSFQRAIADLKFTDAQATRDLH